VPLLSIKQTPKQTSWLATPTTPAPLPPPIQQDTLALTHAASHHPETPETLEPEATPATSLTPLRLFGLPYAVGQYRLKPQHHVNGPLVFPIQDKAVKGYTNPQGRYLALGDMHGSWLKVAELLSLHGLMRCSPETWADLQQCGNTMSKLQAKDPYVSKSYQQASQAKLDASFQEALKKVTWGGTQEQTILFLGDVLSDQGASDFMTLRLLARLQSSKHEQAKAHHVKPSSAYEVVLSNHDMQALRDWYTHYVMPVAHHPDMTQDEAHFKQTPPPALHRHLLTPEHTSFASTYHYASTYPEVYKSLGKLYGNYFHHLHPLMYKSDYHTLLTHTAPNAKTFHQFYEWLIAQSHQPHYTQNMTPKAFEAHTQSLSSWFQSSVVTPGMEALALQEKPTHPQESAPLSTKLEKAMTQLGHKAWDPFLNAKDNPFAVTHRLPVETPLVSHWLHGHITSFSTPQADVVHLPPLEAHGKPEARQYRIDLNSKVRHGLRWEPAKQGVDVEHTLWLENPQMPGSTDIH
jgi:hypothetical protein